MKTVSAKEFQTRQSAILKKVAGGESYQVTFHRKPFVILSPAQKSKANQLKPGSREAFRESLNHTVKASGDLQNLSYKQLKQRMMNDKYGQ
jgi:antitoxin (DNA-binding transcriptional repressor) of toxin-antitoxin stability system